MAWVAFKKFGRWQKPAWVSMSGEEIQLARRAVHVAYVEWSRGKSPADRLGFVPLTFARSALGKAGIELPKIADEDLMLGYAMYQTIRLFPGSYESGPSAPALRIVAIYTDAIHDDGKGRKLPRSIEELDGREVPREEGVVLERSGGALKVEKRLHALEDGVTLVEWTEFGEGRWLCTSSFALTTDGYAKLLGLGGGSVRVE